MERSSYMFSYNMRVRHTWKTDCKVPTKGQSDIVMSQRMSLEVGKDWDLILPWASWREYDTDNRLNGPSHTGEMSHCCLNSAEFWQSPLLP